jgi:hypothetical protein
VIAPPTTEVTQVRYTVLTVCFLLLVGCSADGSGGGATPQDKMCWWINDDMGGADSAYAVFDSIEEAASINAYVEFDCNAGSTASVAFDGMGRGDFDYRASVRVTVEVNDETYAVPGAQRYVTPAEGSGIVPVSMSGVFIVPESGTCRVALRGKAFVGALELFGAGTLLVQVIEPASQ